MHGKYTNIKRFVKCLVSAIVSANNSDYGLDCSRFTDLLKRSKMIEFDFRRSVALRYVTTPSTNPIPTF